MFKTCTDLRGVGYTPGWVQTSLYLINVTVKPGSTTMRMDEVCIMKCYWDISGLSWFVFNRIEWYVSIQGPRQ